MKRALVELLLNQPPAIEVAIVHGQGKDVVVQVLPDRLPVAIDQPRRACADLPRNNERGAGSVERVIPDRQRERPARVPAADLLPTRAVPARDVPDRAIPD
jgi:hypothetical protein